MSDFGVTPEGYNRKPLSVILSEIEELMITEFGPGVIQTAQSPLGQINGLFADLIAEIEERNLEIYQSYDPDQAESTRLEILARLRLIDRQSQFDGPFRKDITNEGRSRIDIQDFARALQSVDGVEYSKVFVNETLEIDERGLEPGTLAAVVYGGGDTEIADVVRKYVVPGIKTFGNYRVDSNIDGYCRTTSIVRPILVPVKLSIQVSAVKERFDCPPPSPTVIKNFIQEKWLSSRQNGVDVDGFLLRSMIECEFPNVKMISFAGSRDGLLIPANQSVSLGFIEIAELTADMISMTFVDSYDRQAVEDSLNVLVES